jgi:hypothetical protein
MIPKQEVEKMIDQEAKYQENQKTRENGVASDG